MVNQKSSEKRDDSDKIWSLTLWVALKDIDENMGPLRFVKESHGRRYHLKMVPITDTTFWQNPFANKYKKINNSL